MESIAVLFGLALFGLAETRATDDNHLTGYASAYAPGVMESTVRYRLDTGNWRIQPPYDWYTAHGYIATNNCAEIGAMMTLIDPAGRKWRVLVADCGGAEPDGGAAWMTRNNIIAELDAKLWRRLTEVHGRPLKITIK